MCRPTMQPVHNLLGLCSSKDLDGLFNHIIILCKTNDHENWIDVSINLSLVRTLWYISRWEELCNLIEDFYCGGQECWCLLIIALACCGLRSPLAVLHCCWWCCHCQKRVVVTACCTAVAEGATSSTTACWCRLIITLSFFHWCHCCHSLCCYHCRYLVLSLLILWLQSLPELFRWFHHLHYCILMAVNC